MQRLFFFFFFCPRRGADPFRLAVGVSLTRSHMQCPQGHICCILWRVFGTHLACGPAEDTRLAPGLSLAQQHLGCEASPLMWEVMGKGWMCRMVELHGLLGTWQEFPPVPGPAMQEHAAGFLVQPVKRCLLQHMPPGLGERGWGKPQLQRGSKWRTTSLLSPTSSKPGCGGMSLEPSWDKRGELGRLEVLGHEIMETENHGVVEVGEAP